MDDAEVGDRLAPALGRIRSLTGGIARYIRGIALASGLSGLWLWMLTTHSATGSWVRPSAALLVVLLLLLAPAAFLWFFYAAIKSLLDLPEQIRRLAADGRLRSTELVQAFRDVDDQGRRRRRVWNVFRGILELRSLLFRGRGIFLAAGMAVRLRVFNPAFLGLLLLALVATVLIALAAIAGTFLMLLGL